MPHLQHSHTVCCPGLPARLKALGMAVLRCRESAGHTKTGEEEEERARCLQGAAGDMRPHLQPLVERGGLIDAVLKRGAAREGVI